MQIDDFDKYYDVIQEGNVPNVHPKNLTMLFLRRCDVCDRDDCYNKDNVTHIIPLEVNYGFQVCDKCFESYPIDLSLYNLSLCTGIIPFKHFELIIKQLNPSFDPNKVIVKRSNGDIEEWKFTTCHSIKIRSELNNTNIPIINQLNTVQKTNKFDEFCKLNNVDIVELTKLINNIYVSRLKEVNK